MTNGYDRVATGNVRIRLVCVLASIVCILAAGVGNYPALMGFGIVVVLSSRYATVRIRYYEEGFRAACLEGSGLPTVPLFETDRGGYVVAASQPCDGDPMRQAIMVTVNGLACRPHIDGAYTNEFVISVPVPAGAKIVGAQVFDARPR